MIGERIEKVEKFLRKEGYSVKQNNNENPVEYLERLYEVEKEWEEKHQQEFPI